MCDVGDIGAAVGASIHQSHSASTVQSTQAGTGACILCEWHRHVSPSLGGRKIARPGTSFPLSLFIIGLLLDLVNINRTVYVVISVWSAFLLVICLCFTFMPIFWRNCPYRSPFTVEEWVLLAVLIYNIDIIDSYFKFALWLVLYMVFCFVIFMVVNFWATTLTGTRNWVLRDGELQVELAVSGQSSELDLDVLELTFVDALSENDALEKFFESIPGFYKSDMVKNFPWRLPKELQSTISDTLVELFRLTLISNTISELVKFRRLAICLAAADGTRPFRSI